VAPLSAHATLHLYLFGHLSIVARDKRAAMRDDAFDQLQLTVQRGSQRRCYSPRQLSASQATAPDVASQSNKQSLAHARYLSVHIHSFRILPRTLSTTPSPRTISDLVRVVSGVVHLLPGLVGGAVHDVLDIQI
jgi:hypothetical protein